jgi:hypothetical protein
MQNAEQRMQNVEGRGGQARGLPLRIRIMKNIKKYGRKGLTKRGNSLK